MYIVDTVNNLDHVTSTLCHPVNMDCFLLKTLKHFLKSLLRAGMSLVKEYGG